MTSSCKPIRTVAASGQILPKEFSNFRGSRRTSSGRLTSGKGYPARAQCGRPVIRSDLQWSEPIWPWTRAARSRTSGRHRRLYTKWHTHTLTCTHARRHPFSWQLKMADVRLKFCAVSSFWSRLQPMVDEASSSVFRKQNATQVATQRLPWTRFASRTLLSVYSQLLTWFWAVVLTTRVTWAGRLLVACIGAL